MLACVRPRPLHHERWRSPLKPSLVVLAAVSAWVTFAVFPSEVSTAHAQTGTPVTLSPKAVPGPQPELNFASSISGNDVGPADPAPPSAPDPAAAGYDHYAVKPAANWYQAPFSRIGVGADISPLGIGIKSAVVLNQDFDARGLVNFFHFDTGLFEVEGFHVDSKVQFTSAAAALDWYPYDSVFRLSGGMYFYNGNQISGTTTVSPGTSFQLQNTTYYSANPNPATGATPLTGSGVLSFHQRTPAAFVSGGFGKFIPRSDRHWSFPSEFGVIFTGPPTINVNASGWACLDAKQTQCSNVGDPSNPIAIEFQDNLREKLARWQNDLNKVSVYPIFSYSVVYSFNIK